MHSFKYEASSNYKSKFKPSKELMERIHAKMVKKEQPINTDLMFWVLGIVVLLVIILN